MALTVEDIRIECWQKAEQALATHYIFRRKSEKYERFIRYNTLLGILTPLTLGGVAATYGIDGHFINYALIIAGPFSLAQIILSGIAVVNKWDWMLAYSIESMTANRNEFQEFKHLALYPPSDIEQHRRQFEILSIISNERETQDEKIPFSPKEDRIGTRYALWMLQKACPVCKIVPTSMIRSDCGTCGKPKFGKNQ